MKGHGKKNLEEFLGVYRSILCAATKLSPSKLLHNRRMRTSLDEIGFPDLHKDHASEHRKLSKMMKKYQPKMKGHTDLKRGAKTPKFSAGGYVRIHLPRSLCKGAFGFGQPTYVEQQVGPSSFRTTDEATWNAERLTPRSSTRTEPATDGVAPPSTQLARTSSRIRKPLQRYSPWNIFQEEKYFMSGENKEEVEEERRKRGMGIWWVEWYLNKEAVLDCK